MRRRTRRRVCRRLRQTLKVAQVAPPPQGGRPSTVGFRAAERELRIKRDDASRVDLTKEQRDEHIREFDRLIEDKKKARAAIVQSGQNDQIEDRPKSKRADGRGEVFVQSDQKPKSGPKGGRPRTDNSGEIAAATGLS